MTTVAASGPLDEEDENKQPRILAPMSFRFAPPTFTDTPPQYVEAKEGGSITLTCTAFGNPKPSVRLVMEGNLKVSSAKHKVSDGSLTCYPSLEIWKEYMFEPSVPRRGHYSRTKYTAK
ncbi:protein turtle homolog B-like isoform X1 [Lates japonicus]|uniref:Protein turtle homolog B-like isoform X1 n=1 Tax=Lates japonicus TaxID=270547 RepID=A0AAD3QXJ2_LATJO|nr:protein turtle homolog B-like isoform X1 [Lates japonicus]